MDKPYFLVIPSRGSLLKVHSLKSFSLFIALILQNCFVNGTHFIPCWIGSLVWNRAYELFSICIDTRLSWSGQDVANVPSETAESIVYGHILLWSCVYVQLACQFLLQLVKYNVPYLGVTWGRFGKHTGVWNHIVPFPLGCAAQMLSAVQGILGTLIKANKTNSSSGAVLKYAHRGLPSSRPAASSCILAPAKWQGNS